MWLATLFIALAQGLTGDLTSSGTARSAMNENSLCITHKHVGSAYLGCPRDVHQTPPKVDYAEEVCTTAAFRDQCPSLSAYECSEEDWQEKTKQLTPINIEERLKEQKRRKQVFEKKARLTAWELHKEVMKHESNDEPEMGTFFKGEVYRAPPIPKRTFILDSGASFHLISPSFMTREERKTIQKSSNPIPLSTANGTVRATDEAWVYVTELKRKVRCYILPKVPPLLSMGKLCLEDGYRFVWDADEPFLQEKAPHRHRGEAPKIYCRVSFNCPYMCASKWHP